MITLSMKNAGRIVLEEAKIGSDLWDLAAEVYTAVKNADINPEVDPDDENEMYWPSAAGDIKVWQMEADHLRHALKKLACDLRSDGDVASAKGKGEGWALKWIGVFQRELMRRRVALN